MSTRPVPVPTALTEPFWAAANEGRLVIQRCTSCRCFHHPPQGICRSCLSTDLEFVPVSGRGTVYSYSVVRDAQIPGFKVPYVVASVRLEDAPEVFLLTNLPGVSVEEVRSGLAVEVEFEEIANGIRIPQFRASR
jgi:uncharacterized OB-fold protein